MRFSRRTFFQFATAATGLPLMPGLASAEIYPSRPVRMIVDVPAGLAPDVLARLIGEPLSHQFRQNFVVENKPGAGGNVGAEYVIQAAPDGYTLLVMIQGMPPTQRSTQISISILSATSRLSRSSATRPSSSW